MSTRTSLRYSEIFPSMALADIMEIVDLQRRALGLFYSDALDPANPAAIAVACSVDVSEAGTWCHKVKVRLSELERKKSSRKRPTKRNRLLPELLPPKLFMAFDSEATKLEATVLSDVTLGNDASPSPATSRGLEQ